MTGVTSNAPHVNPSECRVVGKMVGLMGAYEITLFISHRAVDADVARTVVELFEKALKLNARRIRCTSIDGYRLPVGADTDEQLRREVFESRAFVGIITPASVMSPYVLFELGARWGAKKHLAPVLACGTDAASLGGPLAGLNALRLDQRSQVVQLVEDIAEYLEMPLEPASSYQIAIDNVVVEASKQRSVNTLVDGARHQEPVARDLEDIEVKILTVVAHDTSRRAPYEIAQHLKIPLEKFNFYLARMESEHLIRERKSLYGDRWCEILQKGRELLVSRGLL